MRVEGLGMVDLADERVKPTEIDRLSYGLLDRFDRFGQICMGRSFSTSAEGAYRPTRSLSMPTRKEGLVLSHSTAHSF